MIRLTGLWESTTKDGQQMLSGNLGNARLVILPNKFKKTDKHPTHNLLIAEREDRVSDVARQSSAPAGPPDSSGADVPPMTDAEAPF